MKQFCKKYSSVIKLYKIRNPTKTEVFIISPYFQMDHSLQHLNIQLPRLRGNTVCGTVSSERLFIFGFKLVMAVDSCRCRCTSVT